MERNTKTSFVEKKRLNALHSYNILNDEKDDFLDHITSLSSSICKKPIAIISLVDEKKQWFKSKKGIDINYTDRAISICHHTIKQFDLFEVKDTHEHKLFVDSPLVTGKLKIRYYAGMPLRDPEGLNIGTLCVIDRKPNMLSEHQKSSLKILANLVIDYIVLKKVKENNVNLNLQLGNFFELSPDMFCIADKNGYFKQISPAFIRELGYSEKELLAEPFLNFVVDEDKEKTVETFKNLTLKTEKIFFFRNRYLCKNGKIIWMSWNAIPDEKTGLVYATARNISQIILLEEELKKRQDVENKFQQEKFKQLCGLATNISHELLNPVNLTIGFADISIDLLKELENTDNAETKSSIIAQLKTDQKKIIEHGRMVFNVLHKMDFNIRQNQYAEFELEKEKNNIQDINMLCNQFEKIAFNNFKNNHPDFDCKLETYFDKHNPKSHISIIEFGESIINIYNNAFEAISNLKKTNPQHIGLVRTETRLLKNNVVIKIADNGTTIPTEIVSKIFNPFFTTKPPGEGKGLGLTASYSIISNNNGTLDVEKSTESETVFKISLPAA